MDKREAAVLIRMSESELSQIRARMEEFGTTNMSAFIRKMAIDGYIVKLDLALKSLRSTFLPLALSMKIFSTFCSSIIFSWRASFCSTVEQRT